MKKIEELEKLRALLNDAIIKGNSDDSLELSQKIDIILNEIICHNK